MLTIFSDGGDRDCGGTTRRDFLRVGGLTLGGLSLADLLAARSAAGETTGFVRDKSVVLLYLSGGASHIETFDPKMTAPSEVRSSTGEVKTRLPGVTFGGTLPNLAAQAHRMAVVRSFQHPVGSHGEAHVHVLSGGSSAAGKGESGYSMGSLYARLRGANHPQSGLPTYCLLTEGEVDGQYNKELGRVRRGSSPGALGPSYAPFNHQTAASVETPSRKRRSSSPENSLAASMKLSLPTGRFDDRLALLARLDRINREMDAAGMMQAADRFNQQAVNLVLGGAADAFDFRKEHPQTIARYDTSNTKIGFKKFRPSTLGQQMLVARRLCEAGCGFVTVHSAGWDMHGDGNNPGIVSGMQMLGGTLDRAVSAFLEDVAQRGLSEKILLVITGDFGRTPRINKRGGRDHWTKLGTLAIAGGGLNMGQVIGQSAPGADVPATDPISAKNLMATVTHTLFDVGQLRLDQRIPKELARFIETSEPIGKLV